MERLCRAAIAPISPSNTYGIPGYALRQSVRLARWRVDKLRGASGVDLVREMKGVLDEFKQVGDEKTIWPDILRGVVLDCDVFLSCLLASETFLAIGSLGVCGGATGEIPSSFSCCFYLTWRSRCS